MVDHIKPVLRDKPDHIIFYVETNDIPSDKDAADIVKSIFDLAMSAISPTCDALISMPRFISRKDKNQHKAR